MNKNMNKKYFFIFQNLWYPDKSQIGWNSITFYEFFIKRIKYIRPLFGLKIYLDLMYTDTAVLRQLKKTTQ